MSVIINTIYVLGVSWFYTSKDMKIEIVAGEINFSNLLQQFDGLRGFQLLLDVICSQFLSFLHNKQCTHGSEKHRTPPRMPIESCARVDLGEFTRSGMDKSVMSCRILTDVWVKARPMIGSAIFPMPFSLGYLQE